MTSEYPHSFLNSSAGIGSSIKNLAKELIKLSCEVSVFVYGQKDKLEFIDDGVKIISIPSISYTFGGFYFYRKHIEKVIKYYNLKKIID